MNIFVVYRVKKYLKNLITVIIEKTVCQHLKLFFFQMEMKPRTIVMEFLHLGTISYTLDQVSLGNEYFGVQSNGDFYLKTGLTAFSSGQTLSLTATVTDSGGLTGTC